MRKRIMVVKKDRCNPVGCGGYLCMRVSPSNRSGKEAIIKDDDGKVKVNESVISDVDKIAANKCPFQALSMINLPEELDQDPIHRFPPNGFSLYKLPIPIFGKVVGIIGRNGIGKSTAMNIIAGLLMPNFGEQGKKATYKDLIERFKGTEAQVFFEKLESGEVKVAYKPQQVDLIPKQFKGTVKELLEKVNETGKLQETADVLELNKILDSDVSHISGGELQRVAIAATVLKKANLYLFDEPTSYLDIKQRIKISKFIKSLAVEGVAVMVIEHDIIILDYLADLIHLMYGAEGEYGITSLAKSTKAGINIYLEGYIRDENMRFRDHKILFERSPDDKIASSEHLTSWRNIDYDVGRFKLSVKEGEIMRRDVIGVLGENGIGKTTFARLITNEIKLDESVLEELKISYKPQYLIKNEELVMVYLQEALKYDAQLITPLQIKPLLQKKLSELSGGELQRVSIAKCLSEKADLYVLDEPSAYLDVEQRLSMSRILGDLMTNSGKAALIIDHDLLFLDYLSKKLLIFEGEPAVKGSTLGPIGMERGMNHFLEELDITFRRDEESGRPRINKPGSQKDREQKEKGALYYTK